MNFQMVEGVLNSLLQYPDVKSNKALVEEIDLAAKQLARQEPYYLSIIESFGLDKCTTILDAGCGPGHYLNLLGRMGKKTVGVDIRPSNISFARLLNALCPVPEPPVSLVGDIGDLHYPDGYFDGILCYGVFMYVHSEKTLREFARVLRPGGLLAMHLSSLGFYTDYIFKKGFLDGNMARLNYGFSMIRNHFLYQYGLFRNVQLHMAETPESITRLCERFGFTTPETCRPTVESDIYAGEGYGLQENFIMRAFRKEGPDQREESWNSETDMQALCQKGHYDQLLSLARDKGPSLTPKDSFLAAKALHSLGKHQEALSLYQKQPRCMESIETLKLMADAALQVGNIPLAYFFFDTSAQLEDSLFAEIGKLVTRFRGKQEKASRSHAVSWLRSRGQARALELAEELAQKSVS